LRRLEKDKRVKISWFNNRQDLINKAVEKSKKVVRPIKRK